MAAGRAVLGAYRVGAATARALPEGLALRAGNALGALAGRAAGARRAQVERNLRRIYGHDLAPDEMRARVRATFQSYARYWVESFRLPSVSAAELAAGIRVDGWDHIQDGLDAGAGVILALPHLGGWEWAGFWLATVQRCQVTVVVEPLEPPELFDWFAAFRTRLGMHVVPLGPSAGTEVLQALKANHIVCLLCDRDLHGGGIDVEFLGERTTLPAGPATLALRTGAPLLPTAVYFDTDGARHLSDVLPPVDATRTGRLRPDVTRVTQALAADLERLIRRAPEQWHLLQPNWPSDRMAAPPA
jgi:KDO2-lipid IV(A) lauroyltransferase